MIFKSIIHLVAQVHVHWLIFGVELFEWRMLVQNRMSCCWYEWYCAYVSGGVQWFPPETRVSHTETVDITDTDNDTTDQEYAENEISWSSVQLWVTLESLTTTQSTVQCHPATIILFHVNIISHTHTYHAYCLFLFLLDYFML